MFKKKQIVAPVSEVKPVEPVKVEELASNVQTVKDEVLGTDDEDEIVDVPEEQSSELTEEQVLAILQKLTTDVNAIKYHLRLDFM